MIQNKSRKAHSKLRMFLPSIVAAVVLILVGQIMAPGFLSLNNISSILMTASLLALMSMAQNTVIIAGNNGIDLSVGAIASTTALLCPVLPMETLFQFIVAILAAILIGAVFGAVNGTGIQLFRVPALIMTLIMSSVIYGFMMLATHGQPATHISDMLQSISRVLFPPIRIVTLVIIIFVVAGEFVLTRTNLGRKLLLIGDNANAGLICGIKVKSIGFLAYVISGAIAGLMGLLLVGYAGSTTMKMADSYTLLSVAAVAIGGTNLAGGKGSYLSGALGALVIIILNSILQALSISQGLRSVIQGGLLLVIMLLNSKSAKLRQ
jgi:ribose transport system permease protein